MFKSKKGVEYYNRLEDRRHFNVYTGNALWKRDFFCQNKKKFSETKFSIYELEDNFYNFKFFPISVQRMIPLSIRTKFIKTIFRKAAIQNAFVTKTSKNFNFTHIGFESLFQVSSRFDREPSSISLKGSTISKLE